MKKRNARFWIWINAGYVKLRLRPGESLEHVSGGPTDEGWSTTHERWSYDGEFVTAEYDEAGQDCDGRHDWGGESFCHVDSLQARDMYAEIGSIECMGTMGPEWQRGDRWQRDHAAEAAGY